MESFYYRKSISIKWEVWHTEFELLDQVWSILPALELLPSTCNAAWQVEGSNSNAGKIDITWSRKLHDHVARPLWCYFYYHILVMYCAIDTKRVIIIAQHQAPSKLQVEIVNFKVSWMWDSRQNFMSWPKIVNN